MESLRRSLKYPHGCHAHSSSRTFSMDLEEQPILFDSDDGEHRGEIVVKIDGNSHDGGASVQLSPPIDAKNGANKVWKESSYEFWKGDDDVCRGGGSGIGNRDDRDGFSFKSHQSNYPDAEIGEDPPSRLISSFLHKQRAAGAELALDMDMEMDELRTPTSIFGSKDLRVSFKAPSAEPHPQQPSSDADKDDHGADICQRKASRSPSPAPEGGRGAEVLLCTSNSFLHRNSILLRAKTRSRLLDPEPLSTTTTVVAAGNEEAKKSGQLQKSGPVPGPGRTGQLKSGPIGKSQRLDEDDEDPFVDDDVPEMFKRTVFSWFTLLQWVSLVLILATLACSLSLPTLKRLTLLELHLWKWLLLLFVVICGRLVSGCLVRLAVFCIERNFLLLRKRVLYFVYGVRDAVQNCLWLGFVLLSWQLMFDKKVRRQMKSNTLTYVTKVLICLLVANLFRLVKTLLVKVLASSFHVSTYFDRIQESLFNQYVIETLSGPPLVEIQNIKEEEERVIAEVQKLQNAGARIPNELQAAALSSKSGKVTASGPLRKSTQIGKSMKLSVTKQHQPQEERITIDELHKLNQKNVSAWRMKKLMRIVRYGTLTTLDEQVLQEGGEDDPGTQIRSEYEAKAAAKKIFNNVARPSAKYIYLSDLMRFMKEDEALNTMSMFEGAQANNRVSRRSLKNWVVNAFRERRALALTLNDTKTAVNKLHQMANVIMAAIVTAIWLLILEIATTHFFVLLSSQILLLVFIFGNTMKMVFEAIIFLFAVHPFDVGDRCEVDGVHMIVEEMNILTTIFLRFDNTKITYPNSILATLPIGNFYRSPDMGEYIDFCVHVATPVEKIALVKERIIAYCDNKKEHWYPGSAVVIKDIDDMNKLKISIWLRHRLNYQNIVERWTRRAMVVQETIKVLKELDVEYRMLPLDVNVRNVPMMASSTRLPSTWTTFNH